MRTSVAGAMLVSLVASAGSQEPPIRQDAIIAGQIVSADTGRPIRGARLRLVAFDERSVARTETTDPQGRYEFKLLLPGRYQLSATADRHVALQYGQRHPLGVGRPIDLRENERFDRADLALPRTSAVEGQLLDEFGDPAPNVTVRVARLEFTEGRRRLMPVSSRVPPRPTDDKGRFRIFDLAPGDYFVTALSGVFADGNDTAEFAPTYYPGTPELSAAQPVRVGVAQDITGIVFGLVPVRTASVSGWLVDSSGQPLARGVVRLVPSDRSGSSRLMMAQGTSDADGRFSLRNVPPGNFVIQAFGRAIGAGGLAIVPFGWLPVTVNGQDVTELSIRVAQGRTAQGRLVYSGDAPRPRLGDIHVTLFPVEFDSAPVAAGGPPSTAVRDNGTFLVGNLSGLRIVRVDIRSPQWSVERITLNGRDVTDEPIDCRSKDVVGLEIVLTSRAASVSGSVVGSDGRPAIDFRVVLFASNPERWTVRSRFVHLALPDQESGFAVQGLPSEDYLAIALPVVQGTEWQDPEFLERIRSEATPLTLREGETRTLELKLRERR